MKFTQSRRYSIVYRLKVAIYSTLVMLFTYLMATSFGYQPSANFIGFYLLATFLLPAVCLIWLVVFNSGKSKIDEYSIEFTDTELRYLHFGKLATIPWSSVEGVKNRGVWWKTISVYGAEAKISFDLALFSSQQQACIVDRLNEKTAKK